MEQNWKIDTHAPHLLNEALFYELGGKAMGINALKSMSLTFSHLSSPEAFIVPYHSNSECFWAQCLNSIPEMRAHQSTKFSIKNSTINDDFSDHSARGKNSSNGSSLYLNQEAIKQFHTTIAASSDNSLRTIVFQQFVTQGEFFILHYDKNSVFVELTYKGTTFLYKFTLNGELEHFESSNINKNTLGRSFIERLRHYLPLLKGIKSFLGFDYNIEGFLAEDAMQFIQLRPIPLDFNNEVSKVIHHGLNFISPYQTNFVFGQFDIEVSVESIEDIERCLPEVIYSPAPLTLINYTNKLPMEFDLIANRVKNGLVTTVLNTHSGFYLSHSKKHLPVNLEHREFFRCFSVTFAFLTKVKNFRAVSNGHQALLLETVNDKIIKDIPPYFNQPISVINENA